MIVQPDRTRDLQSMRGLAPTVSPRLLEPGALLAFRTLRFPAVEAVVESLTPVIQGNCATIDRPPWDCCRDELLALLDFLEPTVEFGLLQPISDYLAWSTRRSSPRAIGPDQLALVLRKLAEYFSEALEAPYGVQIADLLGAVHAVFVSSPRHGEDSKPCRTGWSESGDFYSALVDGRQEDAMEIMCRCLDAGHGYVDFGLNVLQPAMHEVGSRWQEDGLTVAVQHSASVIARAVMSIAFTKSAVQPENGKTVLLSCVEGNEHDLGLHMVADAFRLGGYRVHCLGANVPTLDLIHYTQRVAPQVLGLSVAFAHQIRPIRNIAAALRAASPDRAPVIMVGGIAAVRYERLVGSLGADAVAVDAADAVALASHLLP